MSATDTPPPAVTKRATRIGHAVARGLAVIASLAGGLAVYGLFTGSIGTHISSDRIVLVHPIAGLYATPGCVASGLVSASYLENPQDISKPDTPLRGKPMVEMVSYAEAVTMLGIDGNKLRANRRCDGFYTYKPLWRELIGW